MAARAHLFLWQGVSLYLGPLPRATRHSHHAAQISLGLQAPFQITLEDAPQSVRSASVPANMPHALDGGDARQMVLLLDRQSAAGARVSARGLRLSGRLPPGRPALPQDIASARRFARWALEAPEQPDPGAPRPKTDPRVDRVLKLLAEPRALPGRAGVSAARLASHAALSQSRFLALFRAQTGLPLRRYILWRRILAAGVALGDGADLTQAAHRGGFADSAHFSRVFRANFGLQPSRVLKNSQFVQVTAAFGP